MKTSLLFSLLFVSIIFSCKKEEESSEAVKATNTSLLTAHDWKVTSYTTSDNSSAVKNELKSWTDSLVPHPVNVSYTNDGKYLYSDSSEYGTWKLIDENTIIYNDGTPAGSSATISTLNDNSFIINYTWDVLSNGDLYHIKESAIK